MCLQNKRVHRYRTCFNEQLYMCPSSENFSVDCVDKCVSSHKVWHTTAKSNLLWKPPVYNINPVVFLVSSITSKLSSVSLSHKWKHKGYDFHVVQRYPELVSSVLLEPVAIPNQKEIDFKTSLKDLVFLGLHFLCIYLKDTYTFFWTFHSRSVLPFSLPL